MEVTVKLRRHFLEYLSRNGFELYVYNDGVTEWARVHTKNPSVHYAQPEMFSCDGEAFVPGSQGDPTALFVFNVPQEWTPGPQDA